MGGASLGTVPILPTDSDGSGRHHGFAVRLGREREPRVEYGLDARGSMAVGTGSKSSRAFSFSLQYPGEQWTPFQASPEDGRRLYDRWGGVVRGGIV